MRVHLFSRIACAALISLASLAVVGCGDDDEGGAAVLECSGTCSCDEEARTCSCSGGTECVLAGEGNVTFSCDGNASCGLSCGEDCNIVCPGTTGCIADSGARAHFTCQGTASCEFTCHADCSVSCGGTTQCLVTCEDIDACDLSDCHGSTDCGDGVFACGRDCP